VAKSPGDYEPRETILFHQAVHGTRMNEVGDELKMVPYKVVAKGDKSLWYRRQGVHHPEISR